jgi:hypothetical protein
MKIPLQIFLIFFAWSITYGSPWPVDKKKILVPYKEAPKERPTPTYPNYFKNVALGKNVSVGSPLGEWGKFLPISGDLASITDGIKENKVKESSDHDVGIYVDMADVPHYVQIDLEYKHHIQAVWLWYRHLTERWDVPYSVVVQISKDEDFQSGVKTVFNCDLKNEFGFGVGKDVHFATSKHGKLIEFSDISGRYIRIWGHSSARLSTAYVEAEVYGTPQTKIPTSRSRTTR